MVELGTKMEDENKGLPAQLFILWPLSFALMFMPLILLFIPITNSSGSEFTLELWPGQTIHYRNIVGWCVMRALRAPLLQWC